MQLQGQRYSPITVSTMNLLDERFISYDLILHLLEKTCNDQDVIHMSSAFLVFMPGLGEIRRLNDMLTEHVYFGSDQFRIFPLHSMISSENQAAVFDPMPPGVRKIVIGENSICLSSHETNAIQLLTLLKLVSPSLTLLA